MITDRFEHLRLNEPILRAVAEEGYVAPTKVQREAIPVLLEGKDLMATAQTGTGKTAAFALPMLQRLRPRRRPGFRKNGKPQGIRALILTPTRELALQIDESFRAYGRHLPFRTAVVLGGVPFKPQIRAIHNKPDIMIATPGRLLDLHNQGLVRLDHVEMLVLDEADRMLDMGFIHDVRRIVSKTPPSRQTMFFSATLTEEISNFASGMLRDPVRVEVTPAASVSDDIEQRVLFVQQVHKRELLTEVLKDREIERALVFTSTKRTADFIMHILSHHGISVDAIHSNKNQQDRQRALAAFDRGKVRVLVATDIVARGIDVDGISHVINYDLPTSPESYVHRIGRTARAGAVGTAITFCDAGEVSMLRGIEKLTGRALTTDESHPFHSTLVASLFSGKPASRGSAAASRLRGRFGSRKRSARRYL
jgi:ATP-dependent RNA helicase RhlE